jgi:hypothetical protein
MYEWARTTGNPLPQEEVTRIRATRRKRDSVMPIENSETSTKRTQNPKRFRRAKANGRLAALQETIEEMMGLPAGCIRFVTPAGRTIRSDATVATLRAHWGE